MSQRGGMTYVHINAPPVIEYRLHRHDCPTCERSVFATSFFYEWYGWSTTCLGCGERWEDGEMSERPFMRGWREKSKLSARDHYRRMRRFWPPNKPRQIGD